VKNTESSYSEQADAAAAAPQHEAPVGFFAIGIAINLVLIGAYIIWAFRQWKKSRPQDEP
jgi:hypothetical protein